MLLISAEAADEGVCISKTCKKKYYQDKVDQLKSGDSSGWYKSVRKLIVAAKVQTTKKGKMNLAYLAILCLRL